MVDMEIRDFVILKKAFCQFAQLGAGRYICGNNVMARIEGTDRHKPRCNLRWNFVVANVLGFGCFTYEDRTDALVRGEFGLNRI